MKFQPHLHLLPTEGGFNQKGQFVKCSYVPADGFRKKWQYEAITMFQSHGLQNWLGTKMFRKYPMGFYVWLHKRGRINHPKLISRYVGRSVRHPAIANSRLYYYDGKVVKFYYVNNEDTRVNVTYARRVKRKHGAKTQSGIKQLNLFQCGLERVKYCPFCGNELLFEMYLKKPPPDTLKEQRELVDWISSHAKN